MQGIVESYRSAAAPAETIERILTLARRQLGMDVAFVAAIENGLEKVRVTDGDAESFGLDGQINIPLEESYCNLLVKGQLAHVVPDAKAHPRVRELAVTTSADIGAYVGVPVRLWDGRLFGTLCCLSHSAQPSLDDRDARFMQVLAAVIGDQVEYQILHDERKNMLADRVHAPLPAGWTWSSSPSTTWRRATCSRTKRSRASRWSRIGRPRTGSPTRPRSALA